MPLLLREPGALHQLAFQQPDGSPVFATWRPQKGVRHVRWHNKPQAEDPCVLTMQFDGSVCGFALAKGRYVVGAGKVVEVRDARNGERIEAFEGGSDVHSVAAGGGHFCAGFRDGTLKVWNSGER